MKSKIIFICAVFFGCTESRNIYPVSGVVKDINVGDNIVIVDHDSIRNFMMPMVMPFNVIKKSEISDFYIGDSIKFELVVGDTFSYAQNFIYLGKTEKTQTTRKTLDQDNYDIKKLGETISNVTFLNLDSSIVELSDSDGRYRFISFLFSRCPMPTLCPALVIKNEYLAKNLESVDFIMISFDYLHDTPNVLDDFYGSTLSEYKNWDVWSSYNNMNSIYMLTKQVGCEFWGIEDNNIGHNLRSILIGPNRDLIGSWEGNKWEARIIKDEIKTLLKSSS
tara:strand:- start:306 stop:1139 length:834 start_codon:yes stop_codon:yes gene_type:complete